MAPPTGPYAAVPGGSNDHFRLDSSEDLDPGDGNNSEAIDQTERGRRSSERTRRTRRMTGDDESDDEYEGGLLGRALSQVDQLEVEGEGEIVKAGSRRGWYRKVSPTHPRRLNHELRTDAPC